MLKYRGHTGKFSINVESGLLEGKVVSVNDVVAFQGGTIPETIRSFRRTIDLYLSLQRANERSEAAALRVDPNDPRNIRRYQELCNKFPLRPIRSDNDLEAANAFMNESFTGRNNLNSDEQDYLFALETLVAAYERTRYPHANLPGPEMLRHLMELHGVTARQVAADCKMSPSAISEIFSGGRGLNVNHIRKLAKFFKVSPAAFFNEPLTPAKTD